MPKGVPLPRVEADCAGCGTRFSRVGSDTNRRYCSRACMPSRQLPRVSRECADCGKPFISASHHPARYCTQGCHLRHLARWRRESAGDFGNRRAAKETLLREVGHCERCEWSGEVGILELHHLDRNPRVNTRANVTLLCPNCHSLDHFHARDGQFAANLGVKARGDD